VRFASWNVRSLSKDTLAAVCDSIITTRRDVFVAVETWHNDVLTSALALACPPSYCVIERARPRSAQHDNTTNTNHGGIAVFYRSTLTVSSVVLPDVSTFECLAMSIAGNSHKVILLVVYRPGSAVITQSFYDELEDTVCAVISMNQNFVIVGDFNVHVDDTSDIHRTRLCCLFDAYGLHQHVQSSTHDHGHMLDLVMTADTTSVFDLQVRKMHKLSDHRSIDFNLPYSVMQKCTRTVITRKWQNFDTDIFINELANSELVTTVSDDVNYLFDLYNTTLTTLIGEHAAQQRVTRRQQQCAPWYDAKCHSAK